MNPWPQLVSLDPDEITVLLEKVYKQYGQGFKPVSVDAKGGTVKVELEDGKQVTVSVRG